MFINNNESPLRVCHIIGSGVRGGIESVVFNYYRFIDRSKIQFDFVIHADSPYDIPDDIKMLGCKIHKVPSYKYLSAYISSLKKIFKENNYTIVHSHITALSVFPLYAAKMAGVPIRIAHSHSTAGRGRGELARNIVKFALKQFSCVYPTHFMGCSNYATKWLFGESFCRKNGYQVLWNALDLDRFKYSEKVRNQVRRELDIEDKIVIGHIGRFMPQKNHAFLIDIFAEMQKLNNKTALLLIGDGPLKAKTEEKVRNLGLANSVHFLGIRDDIPSLYCAMDLFLLPSLYEGLPVTTVEAQSIGLPCLVSDTTPDKALTALEKKAPLDISPREWAIRALEHAKTLVTPQHEMLSKMGYDIRIENRKLVEYYLRLFAKCSSN
jgi:glycosyltransferase EpsF